MKKIEVKEVILQKFKRIHPMIETHPFTWGEIKKELEKAKIELQDDDLIESYFEEGDDYGDSSTESQYIFKVTRTRLETDAELAKREEGIKRFKASQKLARKVSYEQAKQTYEKLKKEFEYQFKAGEQVYYYDLDSNYCKGIICEINGECANVLLKNTMLTVVPLDQLTLVK